MTIELIMRIWATYTVVAALALLTGSAFDDGKTSLISVTGGCFAFCCTWPFATAAAAVMVIWLL